MVHIGFFFLCIITGSATSLDTVPVDTTGVKVTCIAACFVVSLVGFVLSKKLKGSSLLFDAGSALAAGVMLSTAMVHVMPDASAELGEWSEECLGNYPFAHLLACFSFVILVCIEKVTQAAARKSHLNSCSSLPGTAEILKDNSGHDEEVSRLARLPESQALIVFVALNFHSIMEGLPMGTETSQKAWVILIALASHKGLEAFALASALLRAQVPHSRFILYCFLYSSATPLGICLGWATAAQTEGCIAAPICAALAAGTFLWVATVEFLPQAFSAECYTCVKCIALLGGFMAMSVVAIWA